MEQVATFFPSPLGMLHITCNHSAVTGVLFTEDAAAQSSDAHPLLLRCVQQLTEYFDGNRMQFDLPLAQPGTLFQQKAWQLLHQVPFGKTISYLQMAKQYGEVKAIRALAAANGKNKIAIMVPCHRVIGSNQSLTGYAGGLWRKKWLLEHEAKHAGVGQQLQML